MDQWIQQLRSPDANKRKEAIVNLANTKDAAVLPYLKYVYENDPDPQIRQVAAKAGAFVQKQAGTDPAPAPRQDPQAAAPRAQPASAKDKQKAKQMLDRAMDYHMRGDKAKTIESLRRAVQMDADLRRDRVALGLASDLFARRPEEAMNMLFDESSAAVVIERARKHQTSQQQVVVSDDMNNALTYLAVYGAIYFIGIALLLIVAAVIISPETLAMALPTEDPELANNLRLIGPPLLILIALIYAALAILGHLAVTWAIHTVAKYMMVGSGNFFGFLSRYTLMQIILMSAQFVSYGVVLVAPSGETLFLYSLGWTIGGIYALWYLVRMIARYYNIGSCAGCMSIIGGAVLLAILYAISLFFLATLLQVFANLAA